MSRRSIVVISGGLLLCSILLCAFVLWSANKEKKTEEVPLSGEAAQLRLLKEAFGELIEEKGGEEAYAAFLAQVPSNSIEPHSQAHAFGEALYEVEGLPGLQACDASFEFGCYHSFFGAAVYAEGIETLPQFNEACRNKYRNKNLPCEHGIGHGVLVYTDYDNLEKALELCETINTMPTGGCSSGVFMEYNFHTMDDTDRGSFVRASDDLYNPCNTLPERFQASCYFEQVQWWQQMFHGDFKKIGELCAALSEDSAAYTACYNGAGNYAAAQGHLVLEDTAALCAQMPSEKTKGLCHEGASWLIYGNGENKEDAPALCQMLAEPYKTQCLQKLNF